MTGLIVQDPKALVVFNEEQVDLIKRTIAKDATDDELKLFLYQCQRTGLDPFNKQIYFSKYKNHKTGVSNVTKITAIDGYRLIADRTGKYAGNDEPVYDNEEKPRKATVTVYKLVNGVRCPFTASARWEQYYPGQTKGFMWDKMPHLMLGKCAEALALRKAFPNELSGVYTKEEMDQAHEDHVTKEVQKEPIKDINPKPPEPLPAGKYDKFNRAHQVTLVKEAARFSIQKRDELMELGEILHGHSLEHLAQGIEEYLKQAGVEVKKS